MTQCWQNKYMNETPKMGNEYTLAPDDAKTLAILENLKITNFSYYERRRESGDLIKYGILPTEVKEEVKETKTK